MDFTFQPNIEISTISIGELPSLKNINTYCNEPHIEHSDVIFTRKHGGKITNLILDNLTKNNLLKERSDLPGYYWTFSIKSKSLLKDTCPDIPGWKCEIWTKDNTASKNIKNVYEYDENFKKYLIYFSSKHHEEIGLSPVEFLASPLKVEIEDDIDTSKLFSKKVNEIINNSNSLKIINLKEGELVKFDQQTLTRTLFSKRMGYRYCFEAFFSKKKPINSIKNQTEIYIAGESYY